MAPAWEMAVGGDLALPEVEGHRPMTLRLTNAYVERLLRVAECDPVVAAAFNDVADLLASPQSIVRPRVLCRVLRGPRWRPAPVADRAGSLQRSAIVDAMGARAMRLRSGAGSEGDVASASRSTTSRSQR